MKHIVLFIVTVVLTISISSSYAQYMGNMEQYSFFVDQDSKHEIILQSALTKFNGASYDDEANSIIIYTESDGQLIDTVLIYLSSDSFEELLTGGETIEPDDVLILLNGEEQEYEVLPKWPRNDFVIWEFKNKPNTTEIELIKTPSRDRLFPKHGFQIFSLSPLKQIKAGISFSEIQCKDSLVLVQKYNGSPACVKPETKEKLIERGWSRVENSITITDTDMTINYQMSSGKISSILGYSKEASGIGQLTQTSLFLMLDTTENGDLTLILPRNVIEAKVGDIDDGFLVILDEMETEFTETKSITHRTISFSFPAGTKIVEIIGYGFYNEKFSNYPG